MNPLTDVNEYLIGLVAGRSSRITRTITDKKFIIAFFDGLRLGTGRRLHEAMRTLTDIENLDR